MEIKVLKNILSANDQVAGQNRAWLDRNQILAVNLMASPGAGKTSLIVETVKGLKGKISTAVVVGDISLKIDAERIAREGVPVVQVNAGGECHLDASMVFGALSHLPLATARLLLIENVGNLVCPAEFVLGEHIRVVVASTPEGDDKPYKYPLMFHQADAVVLNKIDLLPYLKFDVAAFTRAIQTINGKARIFPLSCATGQGVAEWVNWLTGQIKPNSSAYLP